MTGAMLLTLASEGHRRTFSFDESVRSILWVSDAPVESIDDALACVEYENGRTFLKPAKDCNLMTSNGDFVEKTPLDSGSQAVFSIQSPAIATPAILYVRASTRGMRTFKKLGFSHDVSVEIGRDSNDFRYSSGFVSSHHARLSLVGDSFTIEDLGSSNGTFVNGQIVAPGVPIQLTVGDVVQILDLTFMVGHRLISVNSPDELHIGEIAGAGYIDHEAFKNICPPASETEGDLPLFYPAPRLAHSIHETELRVDEPPAPQEDEEQSALMQMGPSFLMGITSVIMLISAISRIMNGADMMTTLPMIAMSVSMVGGAVIWPIISNKFKKKQEASREAKRESTYTDYLNGIEAKLSEECEKQALILNGNRVSIPDLIERADTHAPRLMNRSAVHGDFLDLRVGIGDADLKAKIRWPDDRFSMSEDTLLAKVKALAKNPPWVRDVPLAFNPAEHFVAGIVGDRTLTWAFMRGLLIQVCTLYSYQDVRIVLIADPAEQEEWEFLRNIPHVFDSRGESRAIAIDSDSLMGISMQLERALDEREEIRSDVYSDYGVYYLIVCASSELAETSDTLSKIAEMRQNKGMSLLYMGQELKDLPRECGYVIDLSEEGVTDFSWKTQELDEHKDWPARSARMFERKDVSGTLLEFDPDIYVGTPDAYRVALDLSSVHLDIAEQRSAMPSSVGFLEMFEVGTTAHLNIGQRWAEHDASRTLQTPLGLDAQGEQTMLNLHEKVHGPHGLIAGTTGSGKSEFIITYILSMCVNYPPDQVAFVLIDYKGGGLAGAFDNERVQLPHLAGTITNLDGAAISRSLVSIKSELKRRQDMFNKARDITGEGTIDIYKYLSYYRQGVLKDPLPHLFIVADEFAELKQQEPEFMDELISAARIGRSLGVHLILATQKPSGVVNDQIWSNSRFKVCLKVADAGDSKEMIQRPDAAEIREPGRYYMLVGYNEFFTCGQAAWAGGSYTPTERFEPKRDTAVEMIDETGEAIASLRPPSTAQKTDTSELNAVLDQIVECAELAGKHAERLWLDPIPNRISLASVESKYGFERQDTGLVAVIGAIDDPERQRQDIFTANLSAVGNVMLYGSQGSGVDSLAATMAFSLCKEYLPEEINIYLIDLGDGSLAALGKLPQCGGVVLPGDDELLSNLFKLILSEIEVRRKLFAESGGGIDSYNATAEKPVPHIVVLLANMAAFNELYEDFTEQLISITRDAPRYGIHFIVTASAATVPRMRLKTNFGLDVVTAFNDANDYVTILGSMTGIVAPKSDKRGLVKVGKKIFEFQGASISEEGEQVRDCVANLAETVEEKSSAKAKPIPRLPETVHPADMVSAVTSNRCVPIGFRKDDVSPVSFDLGKSPYMLVLGNDVDDIGRYLRGLRDTLLTTQRASYLFIDPQGLLGDVEDDPGVVQDLDIVEEAVKQISSGDLVVDILVATSIGQIMANLSDESKKAFQDYIVSERGTKTTGIVAASELWRVRGTYDQWYKVLTAYGNGIWVGSGFSDQTTFRFARALSEYRQPAKRSEGYLVMRGAVDGVRFVEANDEPQEE
ncbi:MAG: type VII secretion protein EssC [Coriobacteriales bacterium]|jgi:S-DNA-T family DNA segregation ATPase FtsK/SpoIIIE